MEDEIDFMDKMRWALIGGGIGLIVGILATNTYTKYKRNAEHYTHIIHSKENKEKEKEAVK